MSASILLAYATRSGSTLEVAQSMVETLQKAGREVDLKPAKMVNSLEGYQLVILGAPLYMFHWHADALHFLSRHRSALKAIPVAIFALGPFHNNNEEMQGARTQLDKDLAKYSWLVPVEIEVFPGKFDPDALRFPFSWIGPLKKMPASDERDWDAIRSWTSSLQDK